MRPFGSTNSFYSSLFRGYVKESDMRGSSSLQDFSSYRKGTVDDGDLNAESNILPSSSFQLQEDEAAYGSKSHKVIPFPATSWRFKWCWKAVGAAVVFLVITFLVFILFRWRSPHWTQEKLQYAIVLDCGSTGTRVYAYAWGHKNVYQQGESPIVMHPVLPQNGGSGLAKRGRAYQRMETEPGFDKLLNNESGVKNALEPLLQWAEKQVPVHARRNTPLFLLATAGLRKLPASDSEWLLDKAWTILEKSSFMCRRTWVKVISGVEEAYYGWIALNFNLGRLGHVRPMPTVGALDLGGSSLQVTFESQDMSHGEYGMNLTVGSKEHHLYAYSHPGFGLNDAFDRSVTILLMQSNKTSNALAGGNVAVYHPCLQTGYIQEYKCNYCGHKLSPAAGATALSWNTGDNKTGSIIDLIGKPDWPACKILAMEVANSSISLERFKCDVSPCALGRYQPEPHGQFYALAGFFVVYKFFNLSRTAKLEELLQKGKIFCSKSWIDAQNSVTPQPFVEQYCFRAPYVASLLEDGLHLKGEQLVVGSGNMTWTLGAALLEAGALLPNKMKNAAPRKSNFDIDMREGPLMLDTWILTVLVFVILLMAIVAIGFLRQRFKCMWHKPYLPLFSQPNPNSTPPAWLPPMLRSPVRLGMTGGLNGIRNGDGRYKAPHSPAPINTVQDVSQQKFGSGFILPAGSSNSVFSTMQSPAVQSGSPFPSRLPYHMFMKMAHKGNSQLQSRRTQSRDDLYLYIGDNHNSKV